MENLITYETDLIRKREEYVNKFLNYIDVSKLTEKEYETGLRMFFEYCVENKIQNVKREDIINYRDLLQLQGKAANTINLYLTSIKTFFKWLSYEGLYRNIAENIKSLPVETTHIRQSLSLEDSKKLISICKDEREEIIITLALTTGIRCNEMCNIRLQDFVQKNGKICLYVLGKARKGTKSDFVVISETVFKKIGQYVKDNNITDYLFISRSNNNKNKPISTRSMREIVNNVYERAGMKNKNLVFHSLRHSNASLSIQNGIDIREVSQNLRHKSITTTMRYLHDLEMINNSCSNSVTNLLAIS